MERQKVDIGEHSQSFPLRCTDRRCPRVPEPRVPLRRLDWKPLEGTPRLGSRYEVVALTIAEFIPRQVMHLQQILAGFPLLGPRA
jgi:hypothetical protein